MSKYIIKQCLDLKGNVRISGSKNAVLPILTASLLANELVTLTNVPDLRDVTIMKQLLENLGVRMDWDKTKESIAVNAESISKMEAEYDLVTQMRASFLIMGPLLARMGYAKIPLPGGCAIGTRPVDLHLKGFAAMGAEIAQEHGYVEVKAKKLQGAKIYLDFPSVGATENIVMAASGADGQTIIENAALEPEIVDLANFLNEMGADIKGAGTDTIKVNGVKDLKGATHDIIPDRIEAGTYMSAAAIAKGDVVIENIVIDHLKPIIAKLKESGVFIEEQDNSIHICHKELVKPIDIKTMPYPGFPTDMQAPFMSLVTGAQGTSMIVETVFENRYMHAGELSRMGADIKIDGRTAVIEGVKKLTGTQVKATDLRAGAGLILAALVAEGTTEIADIYHIERGYCSIEQKLRKLGVSIEKIDE
jgi:UDP-N-acetylglucosamine 1-carboxyvinyltransferase